MFVFVLSNVERKYAFFKHPQRFVRTYFQLLPFLNSSLHINLKVIFCQYNRKYFLAFCYVGRGAESKGCNAKEGNPFGPFWDTFNVDFIGSEFYNPLNYDVYHSNMSEQWNAKYRPSDWPGKLIVLIFFPSKSTGALDQQLLSGINR